MILKFVAPRRELQHGPILPRGAGRSRYAGLNPRPVDGHRRTAAAFTVQFEHDLRVPLRGGELLRARRSGLAQTALDRRPGAAGDFDLLIGLRHD